MAGHLTAVAAYLVLWASAVACSAYNVWGIVLLGLVGMGALMMRHEIKVVHDRHRRHHPG